MMAILIRKIGNQKYAYVSQRIGDKIVQRYLGPLSNSKVAEKIGALKQEKKVPKELHTLFWDTDPNQINFRIHRQYVIEKVLEFGDLFALNWIQNIYPTKWIIETCLTSRRISDKSRNFWMTWFGAKHAH